MDKQIRKLKKVAKKEVKGLASLEKMDKKHDKEFVGKPTDCFFNIKYTP